MMKSSDDERMDKCKGWAGKRLPVLYVLNDNDFVQKRVKVPRSKLKHYLKTMPDRVCIVNRYV